MDKQEMPTSEPAEVVEETAERKETRELHEYIESEVFTKFGLTKEAEEKALAAVTEEQKKDKAFMQERSDRLNQLEKTAIYEAIKAVEDKGFNEWYSATRRKLDEPYTMRSDRSPSDMPFVDASKFTIRKTKEEITQSLDEEKNRAERTNFLCVNIDPNKFKKVLAQGGFRDIFSLDENELAEMKRVTERGDQFYMNQRRTIEESLGMYDPEKSTIYGTYASENGDDEKLGGADIYGSIFLKLKPSVEAVYCEGDSMSNENPIASRKLAERGIYSSSQWVEAAQARQIAPEHAALVKGMNNVYKQIENQCGRGIGALNYLEAHIKGLNFDGIESINMPKNYAEGIFRGTVEQGDYQALFRQLQQDPQWKDKIKVIE